MDINNYADIEEVLSKFGYEKIPEDEMKDYEEIKIDPTGGLFSNICNKINLDTIGGFQDVSPIIFVTLAEIVGDIMSGDMPFNTANAVCNFLNLTGEIMQAYAAQQAYFEQGPGRFFNPLYKNINNIFCTSDTDDKDSSEILMEINKLCSDVIQLNNRMLKVEEIVKTMKEKVKN